MELQSGVNTANREVMKLQSGVNTADRQVNYHRYLNKITDGLVASRNRVTGLRKVTTTRDLRD